MIADDHGSIHLRQSNGNATQAGCQQDAGESQGTFERKPLDAQTSRQNQPATDRPCRRGQPTPFIQAEFEEGARPSGPRIREQSGVLPQVLQSGANFGVSRSQPTRTLKVQQRGAQVAVGLMRAGQIAQQRG